MNFQALAPLLVALIAATRGGKAGTKQIDTSGVVQSHLEFPSARRDYGSRNRLRYVVKAKAAGAAGISASFAATFHVQRAAGADGGCADYVALYAGALGDDTAVCDSAYKRHKQFVGEYCGDKTPGGVLVRLDGKEEGITVEFCTDESNWSGVRGLYYQGFNLTFLERATAKLGAACTKGELCPTESACKAAICDCVAPKVLDKEAAECKALAKLGGACGARTLCPPSSACVEGVCECVERTRIFIDLTTDVASCKLIAKPGEKCGKKRACVDGATCKKGICECNPPTVLNKKGKTCDAPATTTTAASTTTTPPYFIENVYFDLVMLIDGSGSVNRQNGDNFNLELEYAKELVRRRKDLSLHFAAMEFGTRVGYATRFHLDVKQKPDEEITARLDKVAYSKGDTNLTGALTEAQIELDKYSRVHRDDPNKGKVRQAVVVVTDGMPESPDAALVKAKELHAAGVTLFAIAIGKAVRPDTDGGRLLHEMTGDDRLVIKAADFDNIGIKVNPFIDVLRACYECVSLTDARTCNDQECKGTLPYDYTEIDYGAGEHGNYTWVD